MRVKQLITLAGRMPLSVLLPEGQQVLNLLNQYKPTTTTRTLDSLTFETAGLLFATLPSADEEFCLDYELNDGVNVAAQVRGLQASVTTKNSSWHRGVTVAMVAILAILEVVYIGVVGYVSVANKTIPAWEGLVLAWLIPGMVIWAQFGLLNKERKDMLKATLGEVIGDDSLIGRVLTRSKK